MSITANTIMPEVETLTPEQFLARVYSVYDPVPETPADYFVRNLDTGKVDLHIAKATYSAMAADEKQSLWDAFRWSKRNGCWISRGLPHEDIDRIASVAESFGLADGGYFITLTPADMVGSGEAAPVEPEPVAAPAPVTTPAAKPSPKAKRPETISTERKYYTGTIGTDEIEHALHRGSGFAGGKIRIAAFFAGNHTPDESKKFLAKEYGIGGCSHDFLNGASGFVDHNASGLVIRSGFHGEGTELKLSWISVASYLHTMVREGRYLTDKEQQKYNEVVKRFHGKVPTPAPGYGWGPSVDET